MITAIDTNVLLDVLQGDAAYGIRSADALRAAMRAGSVIACDVVWAETAAAVGSSVIAEALDDLGVVFSATDRHAAERAGDAWRMYRVRGGPRHRVIADFAIGAHASINADRLLTRDRGFYRSYFKELQLAEP